MGDATIKTRPATDLYREGWARAFEGTDLQDAPVAVGPAPCVKVTEVYGRAWSCSGRTAGYLMDVDSGEHALIIEDDHNRAAGGVGWCRMLPMELTPIECADGPLVGKLSPFGHWRITVEFWPEDKGA